MKRRFLPLLCAAAFTLHAPAARSATSVELAAVVAPPAYIGATSCAAYVESAFARPMVLAIQAQRVRTPGQPARFPAVAMKDLLTKFDVVAGDFCAEFERAVGAHADDVTRKFATAYAGPPGPDFAAMLGNPKAVQWFGDNHRFVAQSLRLTALHGIVVALAPELLGVPLRRDGLSYAAADEPLKDQLDNICPGTQDFAERHLIGLLVNDPMFARIAPARFDLKNLAATEAETRARGSKLIGASFVDLRQLANALASMRSHFGGFDVARAYGLEAAYGRARNGAMQLAR